SPVQYHTYADECHTYANTFCSCGCLLPLHADTGQEITARWTVLDDLLVSMKAVITYRGSIDQNAWLGITGGCLGHGLNDILCRLDSTIADELFEVIGPPLCENVFPGQIDDSV